MKGSPLLLAHSLWMLVLQLLLAFQDIVFFTDNPQYVLAELGLDRLGVSWADIPHSSEWLAGVNATREFYEWGYSFSPGCWYWPEEEGEEEPLLPRCPLWYRLLVGELYLREDPEFTSRTLELCLLALSGSVFLLVTR